MKRVAESKKNASRKQLYHKDRYLVAECAACSNFITKDAINRHWEKIESNEKMHEITAIHDLQ